MESVLKSLVSVFKITRLKFTCYYQYCQAIRETRQTFVVATQHLSVQPHQQSFGVSTTEILKGGKLVPQWPLDTISSDGGTQVHHKNLSELAVHIVLEQL